MAHKVTWTLLAPEGRVPVKTSWFASQSWSWFAITLQLARHEAFACSCSPDSNCSPGFSLSERGVNFETRDLCGVVRKIQFLSKKYVWIYNIIKRFWSQFRNIWHLIMNKTIVNCFTGVFSHSQVRTMWLSPLYWSTNILMPHLESR